MDQFHITDDVIYVSYCATSIITKGGDINVDIMGMVILYSDIIMFGVTKSFINSPGCSYSLFVE